MRLQTLGACICTLPGTARADSRGNKTLNRIDVMKYPIGIQNFGEVRRDGYAYVDKTAQTGTPSFLVYQLKKTQYHLENMTTEEVSTLSNLFGGFDFQNQQK